MVRRSRAVLAFLILVGLGFLANVLHMPLFFGVDFLSGNIFVFAVLALFGTWRGVLAAALAGGYTFVLWGHPYAWIGMLVQAVLVGQFLHRRRRAYVPPNLPFAVVLYWLLLGIPLIALLYRYALELPWQGALLVAFKQAVNDVFNALVAALALHYLPLRRWLGLPAEEAEQSLSRLQPNLLAAFAFFPALIVISLISRLEVGLVEERIMNRLEVRAESMRQKLDGWIAPRLHLAQGLARHAQTSDRLGAPALLRDLRFYLATAPDVAAIHVVDDSARVVLSAGLPLGGADGPVGAREWFSRLRSLQDKPLLALASAAHGETQPQVAFVAPLLQTGADGRPSLRGALVLSYRISHLAELFLSEAKQDQLRGSLLDAKGLVIVSSDPALVAGQSLESQRGGVIAERFDDAYRWHPATHKSAIQGWSSSYYGQALTLGETGWSAVVELPLQPQLPALQKKILGGFVTIFLVSLVAIVVGAWLGRRIVRPLNLLSDATTQLALDISHAQHVELPRHGIQEIDLLVENFETMARQLRHSYVELISAQHELEDRVQERTRALVQQSDALARARDEAEAASRAKSDFLSSMSHELRTPMNAILGFSQLLALEALSPEQKQSVREIHTAGMHLLALINDLLDLSKIESGSIDLSIEPVEVQPIIEECAVMVAPLLERHQVRLVNELQAQAPCIVRADRLRLKQILTNLLSNAIKYNRAGGRVTVRCDAGASPMLRISVVDTGQGLSPAQLAQLFSPFNRLGAERGPTEGTGIGLVITRRLVEMMGGDIGVQSTPGQGSTFWVELLGDELPRESGGPPLAQPRQPGAKARQHQILYIEDNPANLRLVASALARRPGVHLHTAHEPLLGIELAEARQPDLILLDIHLPGMGGLDVLHRIRRLPALASVPVVAISAQTQSDETRAQAADFDDYLAKPVDIEKFLAVIDRLLPGAKG